MKKFFGTAFRDGIVIENEIENGRKVYTPANELVRALWNSYDEEMPLLLGHDYKNLIGWNKNIGIFSVPCLTRFVIESFIIENNNENKMLIKKQEKFHKQTYQKHKHEFDILENKIKPHLNGKYYYIRDNCASILSKNIVKEIFPHLWELYDKDGLFQVDQFVYLGDGIFKKGEFSLCAHRFFRKSFHIRNPINIPFFERIIKLKHKKKVKIAIDPNIIGLSSTFSRSKEWEYWWGPKFNEDLTKIQPGETLHACKELTKIPLE